MKAILLSVLVAGFFCSKVFCMQNNNAQFVEMVKRAEQARQQQEAQYAATQQHYAQQAAMNAQREQARQNAERKRLDELSQLNKK